MKDDLSGPGGSSLPLRLAVVRLSSIGDIILTSAYIRQLRLRFPNAHIDFITSEKFESILDFNPRISEVVPVDVSKGVSELIDVRRKLKAKGGYDVLFDLQRNLRTQILCLGLARERESIDKFRRQKLELVHRKVGFGEPIVPIHERYRTTGSRWGVADDGLGLELWLPEDKFGQGEYPPFRRPTLGRDNFSRVGIAPGARHFTKRWPVEKFVQLALRLHQEFNVAISLLGGIDDKALTDQIAVSLPFIVTDAGGESSVHNTVREIDRCDMIICNDSSVMHMAAARQVPVVTVFGSSVREFGFAPFRVPHRVVEVGLPCRPCSHIGQGHCPLEHFKCMQDIDTATVVDAVHRLLDESIEFEREL